MQKGIPEILKKFELEHEIYVSAHDAQTYWFIDARIPKQQESHHRGRKYVSGPNEDGNVIIFPDHERSDAYLTENWGAMRSFGEFVDKALTAILRDKEDIEQKLKEGCGTTCD